MGKAKNRLFEGLTAVDAPAEFDLDTVVRRSIKVYSSPSEIFLDLVTDIPDDELVAFAQLVECVNSATREHLDEVGEEKCWAPPLYPDFTRAVQMKDGRFRVPAADRHSLHHFLSSDDVAEALEAYYLRYLQDEDGGDEIHGEDEVSIYAETPPALQPHIKQLPVNFQCMEISTLVVAAGIFYWTEKGEDRYICPSDTLEDIAKAVPAEMLIPLILTLEERFPFEVDDDGCYKPIAWTAYSGELLVENGVVWQVYTERALRSRVEHACESDGCSVSSLFGVNGEQFDEEYYEILARLTRNQNSEIGNTAVDAFMNEQNRRDEIKYGRLSKIVTEDTDSDSAQEEVSEDVNSGI